MTGTDITKTVMMNGGEGGECHIRLKKTHFYRCSNKSVLVLNGNGFCFGNLLEFCDVVTYPFPVHPSCQGIYLF